MSDVLSRIFVVTDADADAVKLAKVENDRNYEYETVTRNAKRASNAN